MEIFETKKNIDGVCVWEYKTNIYKRKMGNFLAEIDLVNGIYKTFINKNQREKFDNFDDAKKYVMSNLI